MNGAAAFSGAAAQRWRRIYLRASAFLLVVLMCNGGLSAYSVLTHEEIVDLLWADQIRPLLLKRFPALTGRRDQRGARLRLRWCGHSGSRLLPIRQPGIQ